MRIIILCCLALMGCITFENSRTMMCERSARSEMQDCFSAIQEGNDDEAYSSFVKAISTKYDDPGYYRTLLHIAQKAELPTNLMWDEYGITDVARDYFLSLPEEELILYLKEELALECKQYFPS